MTETVRVDLGDRGYDIRIGPATLRDAGSAIAEVCGAGRVVVITDETVARLHLPMLRESLDRQDLAHAAIVVPAGERTKSVEHLHDLVDRLLAIGVERTTPLVALGGGVIGDLTGFAAAITLRGLPYVQIPTTLLAQVDSSVGGKTGINTGHGKNLIGAFHQPRLVLADVGTLGTLSARELRAGYAEVVKYGAIDSPDFFGWLEREGERVLAGDPQAAITAVRFSCQRKAAIVAADELESGRRALLNLGHTFGHALEASVGYGNRLLHGEAVAIGMVMAFDLSVRLDLCPAADAHRLRLHLDRLGLPTSIRQVPGERPGPAALLERMHKDKKVASGRLTLILARGIGQAFVARDTNLAEVAALLEDAAAA